MRAHIGLAAACEACSIEHSIEHSIDRTFDRTCHRTFHQPAFDRTLNRSNLRSNIRSNIRSNMPSNIPPTNSTHSHPVPAARTRALGMPTCTLKLMTRVFSTTVRGMPTANAEGLDRIGGRRRKGLGETHRWVPFRPTRLLGRSPSASSEILTHSHPVPAARTRALAMPTCRPSPMRRRRP